ncbi:heme-binding protein [Promicromonospora sp. Populi]|uniref:GlcG/HbpS family heme-binding protein n=1 Tax=Promicromonospora sp. Populi TaxID=3239420 RepID=UPI0034E246D6
MAALAQISPTTISRHAAVEAIEAALRGAADGGVPFTISVLDAGGHLVALVREDGAALASIETSQAKARTALYFAQPTADLQAAVQPGAPLFTIETSVTSQLAFVGGGIPVVDANGTVIGAVGAGGASPQQDHDIAATVVGKLQGSTAR